MKKEVYRGILVDKCAHCGGIWLDKGEYDSIKKGVTRKKDEIITEAKKEILTEKKRLISVRGLCQRCQIGEMREKKILGIEVDSCSKCNGVFFDDNELKDLLSKDSNSDGNEGFMGFLKKVFKGKR